MIVQFDRVRIQSLVLTALSIVKQEQDQHKGLTKLSDHELAWLRFARRFAKQNFVSTGDS
jgi:hypothetical protein